MSELMPGTHVLFDGRHAIVTERIGRTELWRVILQPYTDWATAERVAHISELTIMRMEWFKPALFFGGIAIFVGLMILFRSLPIFQ